MKKVVTLLLLIIVLVFMIGYALFHFGSNLASEKVMESVTANNKQLDNVKAYIESDPELTLYVEQAKNIDDSTLPFTTKEEATKVIIRKVGISEIRMLQKKAEEGTITQDEIIAILEENLTQQEIMALKVIGYKEIYNQ